MRLTGVILTYNESQHIVDCIASLRFVDHIVVFDSFSDDGTVELATGQGVQVIQHEFRDYASQRNAALDAIRGQTDWVLFVDADERVTPELADEVRRAIERADYAGYRIPRYNTIFGRLTLGGGWYPDYQTRLLRVEAAHYDSKRKVHELVLLDGPEGTLTQHLIHHNYRDLAQFALKQEHYSAYDAGILFEQGIRPKLRNYILQPWRQFWWRFVTLKGYRDGLHGLRLCALMGWYELRKYLMLRRLWHEGKPE